MKFNAGRFLDAVYKLRAQYTSYESDYSIEVDIKEGNVNNDNIVDCMVVTMTSKRGGDGYGGGPRDIIRTIEIFGESENKKSIFTTTTKEEIDD